MSEIMETHLPCSACGSSDAVTLYDDGHTFCFSCEDYQRGNSSPLQAAKKKKKPVDCIAECDMETKPLTKRGIKAETCKKYGYFMGHDEYGNAVQIANYYNNDGELIFQKSRDADKNMFIRGKEKPIFFGQHLFKGGGKKLIITEGEIDCLTVSQVQGNKYPVVSLPLGASSAKKTFKAQHKWLEGFEEVILMFDMDKAGQEGVESVLGLLSPNKLKIATLPLKDPNECLLAGEEEAIKTAIWNAQTHKPDGIINGKDLWEDLVNEEDDVEGFSYPWEIPLEGLTMGLRKGELVVVAAGTGIGKTTFVRQTAYHLGIHHKLKIGLMMLEENPKRTAKGMMSVYAGKRLHINRKSITEEKYKEAFDATMGTGRFIIYDHFGSVSGDDLISQIRYLASVEGCDFILLDHISIAISGLAERDERKLIDQILTNLAQIAEGLNVGILAITHLNRDSDGASHEEGGKVSIKQFRGSGAIGQLAHMAIGLERNQQDEGLAKNLVKIRLLKCRHTGETGVGGYLYYNKETDRLEAADPKDFRDAPEDFPTGEF